MPPTNSLPARMFNLEGTFCGFLGHESSKPKSIILEVEQEQMAIKLPKELRPYAKSVLKVGDRLQCIGSSHVDFKAGVIKLKAYQVFFLSERELYAQGITAPAEAGATCAIAHQPLSCSHTAESSRRQKPAEILVCRKSGCQKRGGRQMVTALERILQTYQLQGQVEIRYTGCQKRCSKAPNLTVMPGKHRYEKINLANLTALIEEHFCSPDSPHSQP